MTKTIVKTEIKLETFSQKKKLYKLSFLADKIINVSVSDLASCTMEAGGSGPEPGVGLEGQRHRDKTRVQMPAKVFPHLKLKC